MKICKCCKNEIAEDCAFCPDCGAEQLELPRLKDVCVACTDHICLTTGCPHSTVKPCAHIWEQTEIISGKYEWSQLVMRCQKCGETVDYIKWERDNKQAEEDAELAEAEHKKLLTVKYIADLIAESIGPEDVKDIADFLEDASITQLVELRGRLDEAYKNLEPIMNYDSNMPCDTYGMQACSPSCPRWYECHAEA